MEMKYRRYIDSNGQRFFVITNDRGRIIQTDELVEEYNRLRAVNIQLKEEITKCSN